MLRKRGHFERRSAGQLMRRSGRVNQLTAGEVPIRPLLSLFFPSATRFCPARHTTGTHQLASGRSCTRSGPVLPPLLFYFSLSLSPFSSLRSSSHSSSRWARADRESTFLSSGFLNDRRRVAHLFAPMILIDASLRPPRFRQSATEDSWRRDSKK